MVRCNSRFWNHADSNMGEKLWVTISSLWINSKGEEKNYMKKIKELKLKERDMLMGKRGIKKRLS